MPASMYLSCIRFTRQCNMARKKEFVVPVNFTITLNMTIEASDVDEARDLAESEAIEYFYYSLKYGDYAPSDFVVEAQEPY